MTRSIPAPPSSLPDLPDLLDSDTLPLVLDDCRRAAGPITRIVRAVGGNVSHVFRLYGDRGSVILKIRADRFAGIPALRTDPALIADERRALRLYAELLPEVFPTVLAFHERAHALVLTDVFPDGRTFHQHLDTRPATVAETTRLGATLRRVHDATRTIDTQIRSQGDLWFREHTFDFCLRSTGHPALAHACEDMAARSDQHLVLGDLAPKNFSLAEGRVAICDLDNVHRSWLGYDLAYVLAHLLIHHLRWPEHLPALTHTLLTTYRTAESTAVATVSDHALLAVVTAGVMLYRLVNQTVPYPLAGPPALANRYRDRVRRLLEHGVCTVPNLLDAAGARP